MPVCPGQSFFSDLCQQVAEDIIIEDEDTLAGLALLVPVLFEALGRVMPASAEAQAVLADVADRILLLTQE